jgi:HEAT repeat protein
MRQPAHLWGTLGLTLTLGLAPVAAQPGSEPTYEDKPLSAWMQQLKSAVAAERCKAASALGEIGAEAKVAIPLLTAALMDQDMKVRAYAGWALVHIDLNQARACVPALVEALGVDVLSTGATYALLKVGPDAVPALTAAVSSLSGKERDLIAVDVLARLGTKAKDAVPALIGVMNQEKASDALRRYAVEALLVIDKNQAAATVGYLTSAVHSTKSVNAKWAFTQLCKIDHPDAIPALKTALLNIPNELVRSDMILDLAYNPPDAPGTVMILTEMLREDPSWFVRKAAAEALELKGTKATAALPALKKAIAEDPVSFVGMAAAKAVKQIEGK